MKYVGKNSFLKSFIVFICIGFGQYVMTDGQHNYVYLHPPIVSDNMKNNY